MESHPPKTPPLQKMKKMKGKRDGGGVVRIILMEE
jgi:hypothetical protein